MSRSRTIPLQEAMENLPALFEAAKRHGPQVVEDERGSFTLTYEKNTEKADARGFLSRGGPDS